MPRRRVVEETPEELVAGLENEALGEIEEEEPPQEEPQEEEEEAQDDGAAALLESLQPASAPPAAKKVAAKRKRRSDLGAAHAPPDTSWNNVPIEGEDRWSQLVEDLKRQNKTPFEVVIRVMRAGPPMSQLPGHIDGSAVSGSETESPGDMLREAVINQYHEPLAKGPMTYIVVFSNKNTGRIITRGRFSFPSPEEIWQFRQAQVLRERAKAGAGAPRRGLGLEEPPQQWQGQFQQPQYTPQYAPQYAQPQNNDETAQLRAELAQSRNFQNRLLDEVIRAGREGRAPVIPQGGVGVGVPPPNAPAARSNKFPSDGDGLDQLANLLIAKLGLRPGMPGVGVGAPPIAPRTAAEQGREAVTSFGAMVSQLKDLKGLGAEINKIFGEDRRAQEEEEEEEKKVEIVPSQPGDGLPFEVIPVPEAQIFGKPVQYARDKETGGYSLEGLAFANPQVAEKLMDIGGKLIQGLGRIAQGMSQEAMPQVAQVVREIPEAATEAGVANGAPANGAGWPT